MSPLSVELVSELGSLPAVRAPAFIAGLQSNGLAFLRSLGRRGIPVVAMDSGKDPAMYSRYGLPVVVPGATSRETTLLRRLEEMGEAVPHRGVLIPTTDAFALFFSTHSKELSKHFDFNLPDPETVQTLANKRLQYEYAQEQGIEVPLTLFPSDGDIEEVAGEMRYPCLIKPYFSHLWWPIVVARKGKGWGKAVEVSSSAQLIATYAEMRESGLDFLIQERVPGGDDQLYGVLGYFDRASEPVALFTKRKLRQYPRFYGTGSLVVGEWEPEVAESGQRLLQGLGFRGVGSAEFKRNPEDGQFKLMEINPRSISQTYHAVVSGVDIPYLAYRDSKGDPVERVSTFREGVKWIDFEKDFRSFREYRRSGDLDFGHWLKSWRGDRCYAFFAWDDPLPAGVGFLKFAMNVLRPKA